MTTRAVVVDASALVSMLIDPGPAGRAAADALRGREWHAPDLLLYQVSNVLRRRRAAGLLSDGQAADAHASLRQSGVRLWPYELVAARVWALASGLPSYDAASVALAERLEATLITADARLARAPGTGCEIQLVRA